MWIQQLTEIEISTTLWENVLCKLARENDWKVLNKVFKHYKFVTRSSDSSMNIQFKADYSSLLQRKDAWVPNLILQFLQCGADTSILIHAIGDSKAEALYNLLKLSGW